ncbi:MAG: MmcQ/YjbR family DNA-binding protein [Caulobacterales bacterium]|nr:MmcQ/YjbR family DNA-binding protein [Caulobacterales bacterium]
MVDLPTVRRLAADLPGLEDRSTDQRLAFETAEGKGVAWSFMARPDPKKPRMPDLSILAVRCEMARKQLLVEAAPDRFFDDDHYRSYPAVLVRLAAVDEGELASLLAEGLRLQTAPRSRRRST